MEGELFEDEKKEIIVNGKKLEIKYRLFAWKQLEKKYGGLDNIENLEKDIDNHALETIPFLVWIGLDKAIREEFESMGLNSENFLDDIESIGELEAIGKIVVDALFESVKNDDKKKVTGNL